jgi:hypothetical protein
VVEMDWGGNVVWQFEPTLHHDHCRLRSDNTLMLAWEVLDAELAKRIQGGVPQRTGLPLRGRRSNPG